MQQVIKISTVLAAIGFESVSGATWESQMKTWESQCSGLGYDLELAKEDKNPGKLTPGMVKEFHGFSDNPPALKKAGVLLCTLVQTKKEWETQQKTKFQELWEQFDVAKTISDKKANLEQLTEFFKNKKKLKQCSGEEHPGDPDYVLAKAEIKINGNSHEGEYAIKASDINMEDIFKKQGKPKVSAYITKLVEMKNPEDSSNTATTRSKDVQTAAKYLCGILKTFPPDKPMSSNFEDQWKALVIKAKKVAEDELYKKHAFAKGHGSTSVTKLDGAKKITGDRKNQHIKSASKVTGKTGRKGSFTAQTTKKGVTGKITNQENHQAIMLEKLREDAAPAAGKASQKEAVTGPNKARSKKKAKKVPKKSASKVTGKTGREGSFTARTINNDIAKNVSTDHVLKSKKEGTADKITDPEAYDRIQKLKSRKDGAGAADQDRLSRTKGRNMPRSGKAHKHDPSKKMSSEGSPEI